MESKKERNKSEKPAPWPLFRTEVGHPPGYAATRSTKTAAGVGCLFDRAGCGNTEAFSSCG